MKHSVQPKPASLARHYLRTTQLCAVGLLSLLLTAACRAPIPVQPTSTVEASGNGVTEYLAVTPHGEGSRGPSGAAITRALQQAGQARGHMIDPDPRLAELATWVAQSLAHNVSAPPSAVIDLYARHLGLVEPTPHLLIVLQPDAAALEAHIAKEAAELMPNQHYTHYGAVSVARDDGVLAVLVLSFRQLTLSAVPRTVSPGDTLTLQGSLSPGLRAAQYVVTYPDGTSQRSTPQTQSNFRFEVATRGRGEHRIELLADSTDGIQVVANFPVYAGVAPTRAVTVAADSVGPALTAEQLAERLLERTNSDRVRAQRKPLTADPRLAAIGLAHSQDMEAHNFIAHTSERTGTAVDRVARAGVRTPLVLENIGRGYSVDEIHRGLMESPGHRENILNRDATHVGIGVVVAQEDQQSAYLVTEVFARFLEPTDLDAATKQLISAIAEERTRRGLSPLAHDKALSQRCAHAAHSFFDKNAPTKEQVIERLNRDAAASGPRYTQLLAAAVVIGSVDEAVQLDPWFDPSARAIAIGLAQGTRADTFENAIILVALVAF
jgi:uncharacterized protein YkwD